LYWRYESALKMMLGSAPARSPGDLAITVFISRLREVINDDFFIGMNVLRRESPGLCMRIPMNAAH
jgi:hypothetical protein